VAVRFELRQVLASAPYLCVLGVLEGGCDFEVRLAGTRVVGEFFGADPTGVKLSKILQGEFGERSWHILRLALQTKRPVLNQPGRTRLKAREYMQLETVNWPLVDAEGQVVKIACLYDYWFEKQAAKV